MPSSGYIANSFVAGQQPSTAIWNELWGNDASFNSGAGFNDAIMLARHFQAGGIASVANSGSASGTCYYFNIAGFKVAFGAGTSAYSCASGSTVNQSFVIPNTFFSNVIAAFPAIGSFTADGRQWPVSCGYSAGTFTTTSYASTQVSVSCGGLSSFFAVGN